MVVTGWSPTALTGIWQERTGWPSRCTVQAPHSAMPQPNLVPGQAERVAQHPEQRGFRIDIHFDRIAIDVELGHEPSPSGAWRLRRLYARRGL